MCTVLGNKEPVARQRWAMAWAGLVMTLYCRAVYGRLWGPSRAREMIASEALAAGKLSRAIARVELAISLLLHVVSPVAAVAPDSGEPGLVDRERS